MTGSKPNPYDLTTEPGENVAIPGDKRTYLCKRLLAIAEQKQRIPTVEDTKQIPGYNATTYYEYFGGFESAKTRAGEFEKQQKGNPSTQELLDHLVSISDGITNPATPEDVVQAGQYNPLIYLADFDSWFDAVKNAFYTPEEQPHSEESLIQTLQTLYDTVDGVPTQDDLKTHTDIHPAVIRKTFSSWRAALEQADVYYEISDEEFLNEIRRIADILDATPSMKQTRTHGIKYSPESIQDRFGSWTNAVKKAGLEPRHEIIAPEIEDEDLFDDIHRVADELGEKPNYDQIVELGDYPLALYRNRFGSWSAALIEAGYTPTDEDTSLITEQELLDYFHQFADELGRQPTATDMYEHGWYSVETYRERFGSWNNLLEKVSANEPARYRITTTALIRDIQRVAEEIGHPPSTAEFREHGKYTPTTYYNRFGNWENALTKANLV